MSQKVRIEDIQEWVYEAALSRAQDTGIQVPSTSEVVTRITTVQGNEEIPGLFWMRTSDGSVFQIQVTLQN